MAVFKQAVVVGADYKGSQYELPGSVNTANRWYKILRALGYSTVLRTERNAKRALCAHAIRTMFSKAQGQGDPCITVWTGHGIELDFGGQIIRALVPYDAVLPVVNWNLTIPTYQINALYAQRPPRARVFTCFDVCFSGGFRAKKDLDKVSDLIPQFIPRQRVDDLRIPDFGKIPFQTAGVMASPMVGVGSVNNYISFHPSGAEQVSYQSLFSDGWYSVFSKCIFDTDPLFKTGTYAQVYAKASKAAKRIVPMADPEKAGDPAMLPKRFMN